MLFCADSQIKSKIEEAINNEERVVFAEMKDKNGKAVGSDQLERLIKYY
jgi:hypothetical protein